jgi:hypothetical protein
MTISYTFKVNGVRVREQNDLTDVIKEVDIMIIGQQDTIMFSMPHTMKLTDPDASNFTPYTSLTENTIVSWVESLPEINDIKRHIEMLIEKELERQMITSKSLPWAPASEI